MTRFGGPTRPPRRSGEVLARYEQLNQEIMDKQALLNEKLDEQTRFDSLG